MATNPDVLVIGGGIVGASTAYHLALAGAHTLLIDRHDAGRATDAGAGILAPEISTESGAWFDFAVHAVDYYPTLLAQLAQDEAGDTGYARCGLVRVAVDEDELAAYEQSEALILARQRQRNFPAEADLHPIAPEAARELFPALGSVRRALYDRHGARVDGRLLNAALHRATERRQIQKVAGSVDRLVIEQGRLKGVEVGGALIEAKAAVIAGGAWSAAFGQQLGLQIPIEPEPPRVIGQWSMPFTAIILFRGRAMMARGGLWWVPPAKLVRGLWYANPPRAFTKCWARHCGLHPAWRVRNLPKCGSGYDRARPTICRFCATPRPRPAW